MAALLLGPEFSLRHAFLAAALATACSAPPPPRPAPARTATLGPVRGDVRVKRPDSAEWLPAAAGTPLGPGDRIRTVAGASAQVVLEGGSTLAVSENSLLSLGGEAAGVRLEQGAVDVDWSPAPRPDGGAPADVVVETGAARTRVSREIVFQ
ncbi:MAG TPA: FecR domain-containing protein [Anaeromyxobacteraceae bacterium]|nr:FecR domain-containing protein [Anaeromyxobacteraceae bacterium]